VLNYPRSIPPRISPKFREVTGLLVPITANVAAPARQPSRWPQALDKPPHHVCCCGLYTAGTRPPPRESRSRALPPHSSPQLNPATLAPPVFSSPALRQLKSILSGSSAHKINRFQPRFSLFVSHAPFLVAGESFCALRLSFLSFFLLTFQPSTVTIYSPHRSALDPAFLITQIKHLMLPQPQSPQIAFSCTSDTPCSSPSPAPPKNSTIDRVPRTVTPQKLNQVTELSALARICARSAAIICATGKPLLAATRSAKLPCAAPAPAVTFHQVDHANTSFAAFPSSCTAIVRFDPPFSSILLLLIQELSCVFELFVFPKVSPIPPADRPPPLTSSQGSVGIASCS